jgi:hypothetical protein
MTAPGAVVRRFGPLTAPAVLSALALLAAAAAAIDVMLGHGLREPGAALAFGLTVAFGEAIRIALPRGRETAPLAQTAALAYALCFDIGGVTADYGPAQVIAVVALGTVCGVSVQSYVGRAPRPGYLARRILATAFAALVFRGWLMQGPAAGLLNRHNPPALGLTLATVTLFAIALDHFLAALLAQLEPGRTGLAFVHGRWEPPGRPARPAALSLPRLLAGFWSDCMATFRVCPTVLLFAVSVALSARSLGVYVLPIAAAPILVVQRSLRRYAEISATYQQTVRALSRVTELAEYTEPGHARRVCHLALAIGRDLALPDSELLDLEYAALLHDIGQLSLTDPIPGGATVMIAPERAASVAWLGAAVVRQTGVLDQVAEILEHQFQPFRAERADEPVALAGAIIRAANAYDDLVGGALDPDRRLAALQRIRLGTPAEYDPRVVESLTRIARTVEPYPR